MIKRKKFPIDYLNIIIFIEFVTIANNAIFDRYSVVKKKSYALYVFSTLWRDKNSNVIFLTCASCQMLNSQTKVSLYTKTMSIMIKNIYSSINYGLYVNRKFKKNAKFVS